jgi:hypothetical protein
LALSAAAVLAAVRFCGLSSFSSINRSCFFSAAISASVELADCALTREPTSAIAKAIATFALGVAIPIEAPSLQSELELHRKKRNFVREKQYTSSSDYDELITLQPDVIVHCDQRE